jgi:hypothetical protein
MSEEHPIAKVIRPKKLETHDVSIEEEQQRVEEPSEMMQHAVSLNFHTNAVVFTRLRGPSVLPYLHVILVFLWFFCQPELSLVRRHVKNSIPWLQLAALLNAFPRSHISSRYEREAFPRPEKDQSRRPLRDDRSLRGLVWTSKYFPQDWFCSDDLDEEPEIEPISLSQDRLERVLWLAVRIAQSNATPLQYDLSEHCFVLSSTDRDDPDNFAGDPMEL